MKSSALILLLVATAAWAQPATRAEVAAQRTAIEQRFAREQAECEQRFSVAACLDDLRQRRHDALVPLVRREHELAAEERHQRAEAQAQRVRERELAAAQDEGQRRERVVPAHASSTPASQPVRARSPEQAAQARQQAEQKADAESARRRERARERELRQQQRLATHAAKEKNRIKPLAAPLPLPGASAASKPD